MSNHKNSTTIIYTSCKHREPGGEARTDTEREKMGAMPLLLFGNLNQDIEKQHESPKARRAHIRLYILDKVAEICYSNNP